MILLVDIGNSRIKWATLERGKLASKGAMPRPAQDEFAVFAEEAWARLKKPKRIIVSNVAGSAFMTALTHWALGRWKLEPEFMVSPVRGSGVTNAYTQPERLGTDRWAAMIAARRLCDGAYCVVDCGTAITIDVVAADGAHQGGLIVPGLSMMRRSLLEGTGDIQFQSDIAASGDIVMLARDTERAVGGGTLYAAVAVIDRVIADISDELGSKMSCTITGGDAATVLPLLAAEYHHEPDLVLLGLAVVAEG